MIHHFDLNLFLLIALLSSPIFFFMFLFSRLLRRVSEESETPSKIENNLAKAQKAGFDIGEAEHYLNPTWGIKVTHKGKTLIEMPFSFIVHTHLKDYGFSPDELKENSPEIFLILDKDKWAKIPLFLNKENFNKIGANK